MFHPIDRSLFRSGLIMLLFVSATWAQSAEGSQGQGEAGDASSSPRNVILIIGDGMDDHQITIARNYLVGAQGRLSLDSLPVRSVVQVLTVSEEDPEKSIYVADSANSATSMATGGITSRGRLSTTPATDQDLETIVELAEAAGLRTGLIATSSVTDATPAAFVSHISLRFCEDPSNMSVIEFAGMEMEGCPADMLANGGLGSIAEQIAASDLEVILGGGAQHFSPMTESGEMTVRQQAEQNGFHVVTSREELKNAPDDKRLLGLFGESTLPARLRGEDDREAETPKPSFMNRIHWYFGTVELPEPMECELNPEFAGTPPLKEMTDVALELLSRGNDKGFFLMVESASIDKQSHQRKACGSVGEVQQLDQALDSALAFAERNPNTLILVTADHGHAAQLIPDESLFARTGIAVYTPGHLVRLKGADGANIAVNYATNDFFAEEHTGVQVPLLANEEGRGRVPAMLTQPQLFTLMTDYLGLRPSQSRQAAR
ncbi:MAG: alkaline phosphatase [Myxococcota bacterium]|nr:alkaline phosphatase [Myxococcota bacterium]